MIDTLLSALIGFLCGQIISITILSIEVIVCFAIKIVRCIYEL